MGNFEQDVTKTLKWVISEIKCLKKKKLHINNNDF